MKRALVVLCTIAFTGLTLSAQGMMVKGNPKTKVCHMEGCKHFNAKGCTVSFETNEAAMDAGYRQCSMCEKKMKQMTMNDPMMNKKMMPSMRMHSTSMGKQMMMMSKKMEAMSKQMMMDDSSMKKPMMMKNMEGMMRTMQMMMNQAMPMDDSMSMDDSMM
jgi:methylphosphotriester-DNA--protein-cysteine methyltransferase